MKRIGTFLIALALMAGMLSCGEFIDNGDGNGNGAVSYELTVSSTAGGAVVEPGEGVHSYEEGTVVDLVAEPDTGYRLHNWTGDVDTVAKVDAATTTITMSGNYSITANFVALYDLSISSTDGGSVTAPGEGTFTYDAGTVVTLTAEAWEGNKFVKWTGDVNTIGDVDAVATTVTMNDSYAVRADFLLEHRYLDEIGPGLWNLLVVGEGVEAAVTDDGVVVSISPEAVEDPEGRPFPHFLGGGWKVDILEGDFDIHMSYEMIEWPQESGAVVGLTMNIPSIPMKFVNIERISLSSGMYPWFEPREVYQVLIDNQAYSITGTYDLSGTLRIRREGTTVSCYYGTPDIWHELYEAEWSTMGVRVMVGAWSNNGVFRGDGVSVLLRTVEMAEFAPQ